MTDQTLIDHIKTECSRRNMRVETKSCAMWHSYVIHAPVGCRFKMLHGYDTECREYRIIMWRPMKTIFIKGSLEYFEKILKLGCEAVTPVGVLEEEDF